MTRPIRKLAIVGASARAAAFSAIRAGYEVVAADLFADADLARVAPVTRITGYPDALVDWLAATECDAWMYTGALENYPDLVDRMATIHPLLGNCGAALRDVRDALKLQAACRDAGVAFPETRTSAKGLPLDGSWLCKTYRGSSGSGVWRLDGTAALARAERERAVFQRLIRGDPAAVIFVATQKMGMSLGFARQLLGRDAHEWQFVGSIGPHPDLLDLRRIVSSLKWLSAISDVLSNAFCLQGLVGVDLVLADGGPWVIEINPRYTASIEVLEQVVGSTAVAMHVAACTQRIPVVGSGGLAASDQLGKAILFASQDAAISPKFFEWAMSRSSLRAEDFTLADIPAVGETIPAGRPVLTAFAAGRTVADCEDRLQRRLAEVETHLYRGQ
jgi:predicted ATP-grasp superfamily ATP-dependent carboligase